MDEVGCPLCDFRSPTTPLLLSHLRSVHSSDPQFNVTCGINGCTVSSRSFSALYSHIYRHRPNEGVVSKRVFSNSSQLRLNDTASATFIDSDDHNIG